MADLFIIGQYEGVAGTTAVAVGSQVMHMLTVMIVGLAMGTTVSIARAIGADDRPQAAAATGNTVTLFLSLSLVLTAGLLLLRRPITAVMSTPEAAVEGTVRYLTICFPGIPCITAYNILSAIFRGIGDSKSPMIFIFIACLANIALDYLFIGALHLGPAGAALGTSLSQAISVAISLAVIVRRRTMPLAKADLRPQKPVMDAILKIGVPISVQDGFIQISFIVITVIANRRLMDYIRANHLQPDGFSREITLIDYGLTNDTEKFVTEITIPAREAGDPKAPLPGELARRSRD